MVLTLTEVANRQAFVAEADADSQSWVGIAGDSLPPRFRRMRSTARRCWCELDRATEMRRQTQGQSISSHFATDGELVLWTNDTPGLTFKVSFDNPVRGLGLDVEPSPTAVVPGQRFRVVLEAIGANTNETGEFSKLGTVPASCFIGVKAVNKAIGTMEVRVLLQEAGGREHPVAFCVNRIELLTPVGNIA